MEIQYSEVWGSVCENDWDIKDANVVCQQLGYASAASISTGASYGRGSGHIWMDRVDCLGHEQKLQDCKFEGWAVGECDHSQDVGVVCKNEGKASNWYSSGSVHLTSSMCLCYYSSCSVASLPLRLNSSAPTSSGLVEVYSNRRWGTICGMSWDKATAQAVCNQLAFAPVTNHYLGSEEKGFRQVWMGNVTCTGSETNFGQCSFSGWNNNTNCSSSEGKSVECASAGIYEQDCSTDLLSNDKISHVCSCSSLSSPRWRYNAQPRKTRSLLRRRLGYCL